jgi:hypothetical protein
VKYGIDRKPQKQKSNAQRQQRQKPSRLALIVGQRLLERLQRSLHLLKVVLHLSYPILQLL